MISITTLSHVLPSSGERSALIDNDIVFHTTGFPYIPARRIKGLLRESLIEVFEIQDNPNSESIIEKLFGNEGNTYVKGGCLSIGNAYLNDWEKILMEIDLFSSIVDKEVVKEVFTSELSQTTINEDGIAQDKSLRNYRVLNPNYTFSAAISSSLFLEEMEVALIKLACKNLRYMGTRRNRGFGKVKVTFNGFSSKEFFVDKNKSHLNNVNTYEVKLQVLQPLVLSTLGGDQNKVATERVISGNAFRGALIGAYMKATKKNSAVLDEDPIFYDIFLSGKIVFPYLSYKETNPLPLNIHKVKDDEKELLDVFKKEISDKRITKPLRKWGHINKDSGIISEDSPDVVSHFHTSRKDRIAGRSTTEDGAIFYYDAIAENQEFIGTISGDPGALQKLIAVLGSYFEIQLGKSKSAQYGLAQVKITPSEDNLPNSLLTGSYYLHCLAPLALLDENGIFSPSIESLKSYLPDGVKLTSNVAAEFANLEQFNSKWFSKTDKGALFKEGSIFEIIVERDGIEIPKYIGEMNYVGYGKVQLFPTEISNFFIKEEDKNLSEVPDSSKVEKILTHSLLRGIKEYSDKNKQLSVLKKLAIEKANNDKGRLNNHQIGRMVALFGKACSKKSLEEATNYVNDWISESRKKNENHKKAKPIYDALKKIKLHEDLYNKKFILDDKDFFEGNIEYYHVFWKTYFLTLRKFN